MSGQARGVRAIGGRPVLGRPGGWRSGCGSCGGRSSRGLNDGCGLAAELLVLSLHGGR